jgi:hypothetical protein
MIIPSLVHLWLAVYLTWEINDVNASVPGLENFVTTSCLGTRDRKTVEVSVMQGDLAKLRLTSIKELRLLDNGTACQPVKCCDKSVWKWQFSEKSLCGGQLKFKKEYHMMAIANVLYYTKHGLNMNEESKMVLIICQYPRKYVEALSMPTMEWAFYRTFRYEESPKPSQRINHYPSTYVRNWKEGGWLQLIVKPRNQSDLTGKDGNEGDVRFTVSSYSVNFISERNGSSITRVKSLIRNGCPIGTEAFFEYHDEEQTAHHYKKVAFVINLLALAESNDTYAYINFNISLCKDFGADYPYLPTCQGYASWSRNCYQEMEEPNHSYSVSFQSGLLTLQNLMSGSPLLGSTGQPTVAESLSPTTLTDLPSIIPSKQGNSDSADEPVGMELYIVVVLCTACFICGCTLVGIILTVYAHRRNTAALQANSLLSAKSASVKEESRCDVSSLDSGMFSSLPLSPAVKQDVDRTAEGH